LADKAVKLDPHVLRRSTLRSSNKSGGSSFSGTIPFETRDPRFFELDVDTIDGAHSAHAGFVGESGETALTGEQGENWDECLSRSRKQSSGEGTRPPLPPSMEYVSGGDPVGTEAEGSTRAMDKLIYAKCTGRGGCPEVLWLRREIARLAEEMKRLNADAIRADATVTGILTILDRYDMCRRAEASPRWS
jgi:hypothetical protein